jgi:hypothetical protein
MNWSGKIIGLARRLPADQRFETSQPALAHIDQRLEEGHELLGLQGSVHPPLDRSRSRADSIIPRW